MAQDTEKNACPRAGDASRPVASGATPARRIAVALVLTWIMRVTAEVRFTLSDAPTYLSAAFTILGDLFVCVLMVYAIYICFALVRRRYLLVLLSTGIALVAFRSLLRAWPALGETIGLTPEHLNALADGAIAFGGELILVGAFCAILLSLRDTIVELRRDQAELREAALARQAIQEALAKREEWYRSLIQHSSDIVAVLAKTGHIAYISPSADAVLGSPSEDFLHKDIRLDIHPQDLSQFDIPLKEALRNPRRITSSQFRVRHADGSWRLLDTKMSSQMANPSVHGIVMNARDITERVQFEERFRQAQKMESVGRLAGGVAHDYNNMLGVILGHAEMAMTEVEPTQPLHARLQEIQNAARRSAALTGQLLAFARKQTVAPRMLDLNHTIAGMLKMLRRLIGEDIELVWNPGPSLWPVRMDPTQIDQILANLLLNARDAIHGVGRITIETQNTVPDAPAGGSPAQTAPGEYVLVAVHDTGEGMEADLIEHIFEPFFTTKDRGKGTGLGLATVYGIVEQNGGFITVSSEPGEGTLFRIFLPRVKAALDTRAKEHTAEASTRGTETILIVEDEPAILVLAKEMLGRLGYTVFAAATPEVALRIAHEHMEAIHVLVTDVVMPGMNGKELAQELLALNPALRCLFISGYTADVIALRGVLDKGVNFLPKPFTSSQLAAKIRETLDA